MYHHVTSFLLVQAIFDKVCGLKPPNWSFKRISISIYIYISNYYVVVVGKLIYTSNWLPHRGKWCSMDAHRFIDPSCRDHCSQPHPAPDAPSHHPKAGPPNRQLKRRPEPFCSSIEVIEFNGNGFQNRAQWVQTNMEQKEMQCLNGSYHGSKWLGIKSIFRIQLI